MKTIITLRNVTFLLSALIIFPSCKPGEAAIISDSSIGERNIFILGSLKTDSRGENVLPICCICVTEPCPCRCPITDWISYTANQKPIKLNLKGRNGIPLYLVSLGTNNQKIIENSQTYKWAGILHNYLLEKVLIEMDTNIRTWQRTDSKPTKDEIKKLILEKLASEFQRIGLTDKLMGLVKRTSRETLNGTTGGANHQNLENVLAEIDNSEIGNINGLIKGSEADLNSNLRRMKSEEFYQEKIAFSIISASSSYWIDEGIDFYMDKYKENATPSPASKKSSDTKDVVKADAKGASSGAVGGCVAGASATAGPGCLPGAGIGAVAGGTAASAAETVSKIIDWLWD